MGPRKCAIVPSPVRTCGSSCPEPWGPCRVGFQRLGFDQKTKLVGQLFRHLVSESDEASVPSPRLPGPRARAAASLRVECFFGARNRPSRLTSARGYNELVRCGTQTGSPIHAERPVGQDDTTGRLPGRAPAWREVRCQNSDVRHWLLLPTSRRADVEARPTSDWFHFAGYVFDHHHALNL